MEPWNWLNYWLDSQLNISWRLKTYHMKYCTLPSILFIFLLIHEYIHVSIVPCHVRKFWKLYFVQSNQTHLSPQKAIMFWWWWHWKFFLPFFKKCTVTCHFVKILWSIHIYTQRSGWFLALVGEDPLSVGVVNAETHSRSKAQG